MTFKEFLHFAYGLCMGTSTPYLKPTKRFLFPTAVSRFDDHLTLFLGGSGICGILKSEDGALVINLNQGVAAQGLRGYLDRMGVTENETVILNSVETDFSGGAPLFQKAKQIYCGSVDTHELKRLFNGTASEVEVVTSEKELYFGDEVVHLIPVAPAATVSDLVVYFAKRKILFLGPLFNNRIHPILRAGPGLQPELWVQQLEALLARFQPEVVVPAEGDLATASEVRLFINYLQSFLNPAVEFSECRKNFDWAEIPSYTSLEENFDLLREKLKSHTTLMSRP